MTKIDVFSGFLGAGKTTLIKKLIKEAYQGEKLVLIENEFGEVGVDGGFLTDAGIEITEMNSGCICCSLVGDFGRAMKRVLAELTPDRILIEPSGVGKLSDVLRAVAGVTGPDVVCNGVVTVADVNKCKMYLKNFGEFYEDQIENAGAVVLSHTGKTTPAKLEEAVSLIRQHNPHAVLLTTDWSQLDGASILRAMEGADTLEAEMERLQQDVMAGHDHEKHEHSCCGHHDHDHEEHEHGCCGHHDHDHEEHEHGCCGHHDHDHEEHESGCCGHHDHDHEEHGQGCCGHHDHAHGEHEHGEACGCGHDHHHHHADEVFTSFGVETPRTFTAEQIREALEALDEDSVAYGMVLRAKGIVAGADGTWIHFDYVPGDIDIRTGTPGVTGRLCVIGSGLNKEAIAALFGLGEAL